MSVNQRLKKYISSVKLNPTGFGRTVGISKSMMSQIMNETSKISTENIIKIRNQYPDLNINWLINGEGQMLNSEEGKDEHENKNQIISEMKIIEDLFEELKKNMEHFREENKKNGQVIRDYITAKEKPNNQSTGTYE